MDPRNSEPSSSNEDNIRAGIPLSKLPLSGKAYTPATSALRGGPGTLGAQSLADAKYVFGLGAPHPSLLGGVNILRYATATTPYHTTEGFPS
ncbi:hypothetical protein TNCV_112261 [Trichonephila clavipes]|nr:hypothetical protein TNCV_112261 [Trichonephila clavipes]